MSIISEAEAAAKVAYRTTLENAVGQSTRKCSVIISRTLDNAYNRRCLRAQLLETQIALDTLDKYHGTYPLDEPERNLPA